jgi:threonine dehydrogenase-like Zn-dependent dehydrogenase
MKAVVSHEPRRIRLKEVPMPETAEDELLVRMKPCGIGASALHMDRLGC